MESLVLLQDESLRPQLARDMSPALGTACPSKKTGHLCPMRNHALICISGYKLSCGEWPGRVDEGRGRLFGVGTTGDVAARQWLEAKVVDWLWLKLA